MKTFVEKLSYNQSQKTEFSQGYCLGVRDYQKYPKLSIKDKKTYNETVDVIRACASMGDEFSKGVMCGIRDAANERKAKKK